MNDPRCARGFSVDGEADAVALLRRDAHEGNRLRGDERLLSLSIGEKQRRLSAEGFTYLSEELVFTEVYLKVELARACLDTDRNVHCDSQMSWIEWSSVSS